MTYGMIMTWEKPGVYDTPDVIHVKIGDVVRIRRRTLMPECSSIRLYVVLDFTETAICLKDLSEDDAHPEWILRGAYMQLIARGARGVMTFTYAI